VKRALLLVLCACGGDFSPAGSCVVDGWGPWWHEDSRDCSCLLRLAADAEATAEATTGLRQDLSGVSVWLHAADIDVVPGKDFAALYHPESDSIDSERFARSLAHELMHRADLRLGATLDATARHEGWDARGWTSAGESFWRRWSPGASSNFCW
jgi:hypothetical protein